MRVLFVEHGSKVSGGQRSLLEMLMGLLPEPVETAVACPPEGALAEMLSVRGIRVLPLPETTGSFRLHPVHTTRMMIDLAQMARSLRRLVRDGPFEIVHANSVRAGLACALAFGPRRARRGPAVVVHVRDSLPDSLVGRMVRRVIAGSTDRVIAISGHTAANFGGGERVSVIHNPVDVDRFSPEGPRAAIDGEGALIAIIAQITPWKAQDDAIRVIAELCDRGIAVRLAIVGEAKFVSAATRNDNRAYERSLHALVADLGLEASVMFTGEREDVSEVLLACELVLVPSWEEPFGRTIIEAMATATPVLATNRGGPPEIITDGVDGRLLTPKRPDLWAAAAAELLLDDDRRRTMGRAARQTAVERFARADHVRQVIAVYDDLQP